MPLDSQDGTIWKRRWRRYTLRAMVRSFARGWSSSNTGEFDGTVRHCATAWTQIFPPAMSLDLHLPKDGMGSFDIEDVPAFARLRDSVAAGLYAVVFMDLDEVGRGRTPDHESEFVRRMLSEAGARVFNAFTDDGNVFQKALHDRFGPTAWSDEVTDGSDFVCFFPSLASDTGEAVFRRKLSGTAGDEKILDHLNERLKSLKTSRPYSGGG